MINIKATERVVQINRPSSKITTKQSGVCSEDGSDINSALLAKRDSYTGLPFVEVSNDGWARFMAGIIVLKYKRKIGKLVGI